jgi:hypothetical protein
MRRIRIRDADDLIQFVCVANSVHDIQASIKPYCYLRDRLRRDLLRREILRSAHRFDFRPNTPYGKPSSVFAAIGIALYEVFQNFHSSVQLTYVHQNAPFR